MKIKPFFVTIFLVQSILFLGCSEKISIEHAEKTNANVLAWTNSGKALTSQDIQQDNVLNVLYVQNDVYGLIYQLEKEANPNIKIDWYSKEKIKIAQTKIKWNYDERFPDFFVAQNGTKVVAVNGGNRVQVYDGQGKELRHFSLLENQKYNTEWVFYGAVSKDFELLFSGVYFAQGTRLVLRTLQNKIVFNNFYDGWQIRAVAISPDKKYFVASLYKQGDPIRFKTIILDKKGEQLFESAMRSRRLVFNPQNSRVVFIDRSNLELVDLKSNKKAGVYNLANEERIIVAEAFSDKGVLMIQTAETMLNKKDSFNPWQFVKNTVISLDMQAKEIGRISFEKDWVIRPALWFDAEKQQFFYGHNGGYKYISVIK
jgi:hypothetical protein